MWFIVKIILITASKIIWDFLSWFLLFWSIIRLSGLEVRLLCLGFLEMAVTFRVKLWFWMLVFNSIRFLIIKIFNLDPRACPFWTCHLTIQLSLWLFRLLQFLILLWVLSFFIIKITHPIIKWVIIYREPFMHLSIRTLGCCLFLAPSSSTILRCPSLFLSFWTWLWCLWVLIYSKPWVLQISFLKWPILSSAFRTQLLYCFE